MPRPALQKNRKLSKWEKKYLACKVCGMMFNREQALRVHKGKRKHWSGKGDAGIRAKVEAAIIQAEKENKIPPAPAFSEVVEDGIQIDVVQPVKIHEISTIDVVNEAIKEEHRKIRMKEREEERIRARARRVPVILDETPKDRHDLYPEKFKSESDQDMYIDPKKCKIKAINPGSVLLMEGVVFEKADKTFTPIELPYPQEGVVKNRWVDAEGEYYLDVETDRGLYTCNELLVIPAIGEPQIKILQYGAERVLYTQKPVGSDNESLKFISAVGEYYNALKDLEKAKHKLGILDTTRKPIIVEYVKKYGLPSAEGAGDYLIKDAGYRIHYTREEFEEYCYIDEGKIIAMLQAKGLPHLLQSRYAIDEETWNDLKNKGIFNKKEIDSVESVERIEKERQVRIDRIKQ